MMPAIVCTWGGGGLRQPPAFLSRASLLQSTRICLKTMMPALCVQMGVSAPPPPPQPGAFLSRKLASKHTYMLGNHDARVEKTSRLASSKHHVKTPVRIHPQLRPSPGFLLCNCGPPENASGVFCAPQIASFVLCLTSAGLPAMHFPVAAKCTGPPPGAMRHRR